ncbi:ATP-binding protein [Neobacillus niacini]|uniref:ATP-binding protein n=1 Tax=Neobacillus niacini TaxID=86668 RepID=UPI0021CB550F|nr:ATP-binding protein [Neobacillus niacini]MCM3764427.1 ATP-binding protein [Neobacillus niacini]
MWKRHIRTLPLYRKIQFFSLFITFWLVVSTAGFTFMFETKQITTQLTERAEGIVRLWSVTIPVNDVLTAKESRDPNNPSSKRLEQLVGLINQKDTEYMQGYLMNIDKKDDNELTFLAVSYIYDDMGIKSFSAYKAGTIYLDAFDRAIREKTTSSTSHYDDHYGSWITAFEPILDQNNRVIAVLAVDVDASVIDTYKQKMAFHLLLALVIVTLLVYFILNWGIKKVLEPVEEIISGIDAVSSGDFQVKVKISNQPDIERLGERFNQMTSHLSVLFERLSDTYKEVGAGTEHPVYMNRVEAAIDEMEQIMEMTKIQKELQHAEKMNAIGQLAASVAHEIRNPMTVVRGFLQIFLAKDHLSETELSYIRLMIEELNRAEKIIHEYLSLAKPDLEQVEKVSAGELAKQVAELMNSFALMSKNISLQAQIEDEILIKGNRGELKQVVINIVKNGLESMRAGGVLSLSVRRSGGFGVIEVADSGIGMSPEEVARLGTPFYSLKEKGTGMGLMVCYQIVERWKGHIEVQSEKGIGTTFKVHIPLWEE